MAQKKILPFASSRSFALEYKTLKFLGSGSFGDVWTCREKATKQEYAVKIIDKARIKTDNQRNDILREVGFLNVVQGQHPGIVQLKEVLESDREIHLVMEMCSGGDLLKLVTKHGKLPERAVKLIFRQLASSLAHCHSKGIIHRDIKPENILFDREASSLFSLSSTKNSPPVQAKLADFGLSVVVAPGDTTKGCAGSKFYVAPEMVLGKDYDNRVDTWSLGVVVCAMLTGRLPFTGKTFQDDHGLVKAILHADLDFKQTHWKGVSKGAKALIKQMLQRDPEKRLTAEELMAHPWASDESQHKFLLHLLPKRHSAPTKPKSKPVDLPITLSDLEEPERMVVKPVTMTERRSRTPLRGIPKMSTDSSEDCFRTAREPWVSPRSLDSPYSPQMEVTSGESCEETRFTLDVGIRLGIPESAMKSRPTHHRPNVRVLDDEEPEMFARETYYAYMLGLNPNTLCRKDSVEAH